MIRVLLVDDQALVRRGFRMILDLEDDIEVCGEAHDGAEALRRVAESQPDVVLMDLRMPGMDGIEATRRLLGNPGSTCKVLVLTTFDDDENVYAALGHGASGFLLKDVEPEDLAHAVRVVARGEAMLGSSITRRIIDRYVQAPQLGGSARVEETLSEREVEIFRMLARGLSNAEIAAQLFLSPATVKTHVQRVLGKLDLRDRVQAVILAYESGLVKPGEEN
jgi:DNA-binding NarL/FixJ family response regulator